MGNPFDTVEEALQSLQRGELIIVLDDEKRENEGDLIGVAATITKEQVNFMIKEGGGLICVAMMKERLEALNLPQMVKDNRESKRTRFTVSVDAHDTHTGISASERAHTIRLLADPKTNKDQFLRPGHVFPLECHPGGVLMRPGHTESAVALVQEAGYYPAGVICEILNADGSMARKHDLIAFSRHHQLKIITVESIITHLHKVKIEKVKTKKPKGNPDDKDKLGIERSQHEY